MTPIWKFPPGAAVQAVRTFLLAAALVSGPAHLAAVHAQAQQQIPDFDIPYVPTPHEVVRAMLEMAAVGPDDVLYDLGSGDGRFIIAAVRDFNARRAVGIEIEPARVTESRRNAEQAGIADRARFVEGNVLIDDFSEASVVTLFMLPDFNLHLRPRLLDELRPGTRVVAYSFKMGDWEPDRVLKLGWNNLFLWTVPAKVGGRWQWDEGEIELTQRFQEVTGTIQIAGQKATLREARLTGDRLVFSAAVAEREVTGEMRFAEPARAEGTLAVSGEPRPVTLRRAD